LVRGNKPALGVFTHAGGVACLAVPGVRETDRRIEVVVYEITQAAKRQADLFSEAAGVALE